mgnify:CR=1 FL=1
MWRPVALLSARATTTETRGGRIQGPLAADGLVVRLRASRDMRPMAYCYIQLRADDGTRTATQERYNPTADPQLVRIDPGPMAATFAGQLCLIPRSYNRRWLAAGLPTSVLSVWAEAWLPEGAADPDAVVPGFRDGAGRLVADPAAATPDDPVVLIRA